jgi:hypothetical protein
LFGEIVAAQHGGQRDKSTTTGHSAKPAKGRRREAPQRMKIKDEDEDKDENEGDSRSRWRA